jgi:hypothetical protein
MARAVCMEHQYDDAMARKIWKINITHPISDACPSNA